MAEGRYDLAANQTCWIAALLGCPLKPAEAERLNPFRPRAAPPPAAAEPDAGESRAAFVLIGRALSGRG